MCELAYNKKQITLKGRVTHVETGKRRMVDGVVRAIKWCTGGDTLEGIILF
jgi:hypothetical protein